LDLPAQQYPHQSSQFGKYYPAQQALYTPPGSGQCSPQQSSYPYPAKATPAYQYPGTAFAQDQFRRCAQALFQSNLVPQHAWPQASYW
jgi:hypothetical protein